MYKYTVIIDIHIDIYKLAIISNKSNVNVKLDI